VRLYLGRHGEAGRAATDDARDLTPRGIAETRDIYSQSLPESNLTPKAVITSPLVRARQTTEIALDCWALESVDTITSPLLRPEGSVAALASYLDSLASTPLLAIGHQPLIGRLLAFLCDDPALNHVPGTSSLFALEVIAYSRGGAVLEWERHV
jgi:phosphohistidine phosphatase